MKCRFMLYQNCYIVIYYNIGKMLGLPKEFLATDPCQGKHGKRGGGVVQVKVLSLDQ